jgi:hypothetical protein
MKFGKLFTMGLFFCFTVVWAGEESAEVHQTIRGRVVDKQSRVSLPGASLVVEYNGEQSGTITDAEGYFTITGVPVGRANVTASFVGYHPFTMSNLNITSGKELVLTIELTEKVEKVEEVTVKASKKAESVNRMASISARTFTVEESKRYAGARNDVSRMAANYAGVGTANDAVNDIVIRGNSPVGLLWRLEGVDIPNPNHFGGMGATGGPVSMLNNNVLSNSDFITGAFPAEYGNAMSGVFDLSMRNGNYETHEFLGQIGFNGFELGAEGPVSRDSRSSYLVNYRYSTMGVLKAMGINFGTGEAVPDYQDLTFKVNLPTKKAGRFTFFGLGGHSAINFIYSERDTTKEEKNLYAYEGLDIFSFNRQGVIGLKHNYIFGKGFYSEIAIGASGIYNNGRADSVHAVTNETWNIGNNRLKESRMFVQAELNKKINARHHIKIGGKSQQIHFELFNNYFSNALNDFIVSLNYSGQAYFHQAFTHWQFRPTDELTFNTGIHAQYLNFNEAFSLEPRFAVKWQLDERQSISAGYGLHSQTMPFHLYFLEFQGSEGNKYRPNQSIGFSKAHHYVVGYDRRIAKDMRIKAEAYFQDIFQSVVEPASSSFSLINMTSWEQQYPDSLVNGGEGYNYGLELTIEKFLSGGMYYLITASLFESKYRGSDNILRNSAFNGNHVVNALFGKDFELPVNKAKEKKRFIAVDAKVTTAGGQRYTPVDVDATLQSNFVRYDKDQAFSKRFEDYFRADIRIAYRTDGARASQEFALDIQNVTNHQNPYQMSYDKGEMKEEVVYQLGIFPMIQYRIEF